MGRCRSRRDQQPGESVGDLAVPLGRQVAIGTLVCGGIHTESIPSNPGVRPHVFPKAFHTPVGLQVEDGPPPAVFEQTPWPTGSSNGHFMGCPPGLLWILKTPLTCRQER